MLGREARGQHGGLDDSVIIRTKTDWLGGSLQPTPLQAHRPHSEKGELG